MQSFHKPIGILGGTFDPIHFGHLRTALEIQQVLQLTEVRLIPCYQPVHRSLPIASPEHRLAMVYKAIENEPALKVDDCEIQRKGPSYMFDTLEGIHKKMPQTPLCLIMGFDALIHFTSWHRWEDILTISHLVVAHRPLYHLPETGNIADLLQQRQTSHPHTLHENLAGKIYLHPVTSLDISATEIRNQVAMGMNPRFLLPDAAYKYIQQHGIYHTTRI